jgi:hypothetical protein
MKLRYVEIGGDNNLHRIRWLKSHHQMMVRSNVVTLREEKSIQIIRFFGGVHHRFRRGFTDAIWTADELWPLMDRVDGTKICKREVLETFLPERVACDLLLSWSKSNHIKNKKKTVQTEYSLRPKINAILQFKICPTKNAILTNQPQKTKESRSFTHKRQVNC